MAVDNSVIGRELAPSTIVIERGPTSNFARAIKDENPIYQRPDKARNAGFEDVPTPPTFGFAWANWGALPELQPQDTTGASPIMEVIGNLMKSGGLIPHG